VEIEDLLGPGERVLWRGAPALSFRPVWGGFVLFSMLVGAWAVLCLIARPVLTWTLFDLTRAVGGTLVDPGTVFVATMGVFLAGCVLVSVATWRARRYAITTARAIVLGGTGLRRSVERLAISGTTLRGNDLVIEREGSVFSLHFEALEDPDAALAALAESPRSQETS
jgi:hypothetical protein